MPPHARKTSLGTTERESFPLSFQIYWEIVLAACSGPGSGSAVQYGEVTGLLCTCCILHIQCGVCIRNDAFFFQRQISILVSSFTLLISKMVKGYAMNMLKSL